MKSFAFTVGECLPYACQSQLVDVKQLEKTAAELHDSKSKPDFDRFSVSCIADVTGESTLFQTSDSSDNTHEIVFDSQKQAPRVELGRSTNSNSSDGQLNTLFKFGYLPRTESTGIARENDKPLTLSDTIPPPSPFRQLFAASKLN